MENIAISRPLLRLLISTVLPEKASLREFLGFLRAPSAVDTDSDALNRSLNEVLESNDPNDIYRKLVCFTPHVEKTAKSLVTRFSRDLPQKTNDTTVLYELEGGVYRSLSFEVNQDDPHGTVAQLASAVWNIRVSVHPDGELSIHSITIGVLLGQGRRKENYCILTNKNDPTRYSEYSDGIETYIRKINISLLIIGNNQIQINLAEICTERRRQRPGCPVEPLPDQRIEFSAILAKVS